MAGFSKVFSTMWGGSLYGRFEASAVFMVFLSLADRDGNVDMTTEAIAGVTGWPIDLIRTGIAELAAPDARSRTPDEEGRRIVLLDEHRDWGWHITNYAKYRDEQRSAERREYLRDAQRKRRASKRQQLSTSQPLSTSVNRNQPIADADADADADSREKRGASRPATHLPDDFSLTEERRSIAVAEKIDPDRTFANFCDYWRAASGQKARKRDWDATWRMWCRQEINKPRKPNGVYRSMEQINRLAASNSMIRRQGESDDDFRARVAARGL